MFYIFKILLTYINVYCPTFFICQFLHYCRMGAVERRYRSNIGIIVLPLLFRQFFSPLIMLIFGYPMLLEIFVLLQHGYGVTYPTIMINVCIDQLYI